MEFTFTKFRSNKLNSTDIYLTIVQRSLSSAFEYRTNINKALEDLPWFTKGFSEREE